MSQETAGRALRLATYNVEWFDALFADNGTLLVDDQPSARFGISRAQQTEALGVVFTALDADGVMIIEAPDTNRKRNTIRALEGFARAFGLRARRCVTGFLNETQQEIAFLFDPDILTAEHAPLDDGVPRFDGVFHIDLDVDATQDRVTFSKPPLELVVGVAGRTIRLIGAHLKSKAPHGARNDDQVMRLSIANRRKQLAQAIWLRGRIAGHLERSESLIVMGDLNDGPGLDAYEHLFGRSSVEIILGDGADDPALRLFDPHAAEALTRRIGAQPSTARFYINTDHRYLSALLDYIMVSPDLRAQAPRWRIWHPFEDPDCWGDDTLRTALLSASDHFPVTLDIAL